LTIYSAQQELYEQLHKRQEALYFEACNIVPHEVLNEFEVNELDESGAPDPTKSFAIYMIEQHIAFLEKKIFLAKAAREATVELERLKSRGQVLPLDITKDELHELIKAGKVIIDESKRKLI